MSAMNRTIATALLALVVLPASELLAEPIVRSFEVEPGSRIEVETDAGSIDVSPTDGTTLTVEVDISGPGAADFEVNFKERDGRIEVDGRAGGGIIGSRRSYVDVEYRIQVPHQFDIEVDTSGGSINVGDLDGSVRAETSGGSIEVGRISGPVWASTSGGGIHVEFSGGDVEADTSGGSIRIEEADGQVSADTSGGSIRIGRSKGRVNADTSGGSITVRESSGAVKADTSGGSIKVGFVAQPDGKTKLSTSGGSVTVYVAEGVAFDIRAKSGVGVATRFPLEDARMDPGRLEGKLNGGGPVLDVKASGRVRIEPM